MPRLDESQIDREQGLRMSHLGAFLDTNSVIMAARNKKAHQQMQVGNIHGEVLTRTMIPCRFMDEPMMADVVTGTLYESYSGKSLSGRCWLIDAPGRQPEKRIDTDGVDLATVWLNDKRREKLNIRRIDHTKNRRFRSQNVEDRPGLLRTLAVLRSRGPLTIADLAEHLGMLQQSARANVRDLVSMGLVWRKTIGKESPTVGLIDEHPLQKAG